jgi:HK97 family phage portal protein
MSFWSRILARKSASADRLERILDGYLGGRSTSGFAVSPDRAMQCVTVMACVRVLSESVAQLPVGVFMRNRDGTRTRADNHRLANLLNVRPNEWQTGFEFREMLMAHVLLRGNAYAYIVRVNGEPRELIPLHPGSVTVEQSEDYSLRYSVSDEKGRVRGVFTGADILHLRGLSSNGIVGLSPIQLHREAVGLAMATEEHGARVFGNGARIGGILSHPAKLTPESATRLRAQWDDLYSGLSNAHRTAVLEDGMTFTPVTMNSSDAQFLETRKYQRAEIASIFRVPPHLIGDLDRATFSNIEHQSIEFVTHSLLPWVRRWEAVVSRDLITEEERRYLYVRHNLDGLLRGDIKSRFEAYAIGRQWGWLSADDIRASEDLNPIPDGAGSAYLTPMNMTPAAPDNQEPTSDAD